MLAVLDPVFCPWELVSPRPRPKSLFAALFPLIAFSNCTVVYVNDVEKSKNVEKEKKLCGDVQYVYIHAKIICMYVAFNYTQH